MSSPLIGYYLALSILLFIIVLMIFLLFSSFKSLKKKGVLNLSLLSEEIQGEQKLSHQLNSKINAMQKEEKSIHKSLTNTQLDIIQIDFSYKEVVNKLGIHLNS